MNFIKLIIFLVKNMMKAYKFEGKKRLLNDIMGLDFKRGPCLLNIF